VDISAVSSDKTELPRFYKRTRRQVHFNTLNIDCSQYCDYDVDKNSNNIKIIRNL